MIDRKHVLEVLPMVSARKNRYELGAWVRTGKELGLRNNEMAQAANVSRHKISRLLKT